jgi:hypothetical protein
VHLVEARRVQVGTGLVGDVQINVHSRDVSGWTHDMGHERRVVTGARANLEYAMAGLQSQLLQHQGHQGGLGGGTDGEPLVIFRDNRFVTVDGLDGPLGEKQMPWDSPERGLDGRSAQVSILLEGIHKRLMQRRHLTTAAIVLHVLLPLSRCV